MVVLAKLTTLFTYTIYYDFIVLLLHFIIYLVVNMEHLRVGCVPQVFYIKSVFKGVS